MTKVQTLDDIYFVSTYANANFSIADPSLEVLMSIERLQI